MNLDQPGQPCTSFVRKRVADLFPGGALGGQARSTTFAEFHMVNGERPEEAV
jgi:hypothetical protein